MEISERHTSDKSVGDDLKSQEIDTKPHTESATHSRKLPRSIGRRVLAQQRGQQGKPVRYPEPIDKGPLFDPTQLSAEASGELSAELADIDHAQAIGLHGTSQVLGTRSPLE